MTAPASPEQSSQGSGPPSFIGQVISGRYRVLEQIGEGGMGTVYLAEHVHMRKRVAIKVLNADMVGRADVVARFEREAMAAAHIEHPNVAAATDFGRTEDGAFFLVLEYIEGTDLRAVLRQGPLEIPRAIHIARQIASALVRAHELGIVHRDLKPENVMLIDRPGEGEFVKVLDFGIAKVHVESLAASSDGIPGAVLTRAGAVFGTPEYMAPEQALGEAVDHRADLYALGVILFEMLSGKLPFEGGETLSLLARQIAETAPLLRAVAPDRGISTELEGLVMRLLEKQPRERFATAEDLVAALDYAAGEVPPPSRLAPPSVARGAFTAVDAMARTSPEIPSGSIPALPVAPIVRNPVPLVPDERRRGHIWIAVAVALCGGALLVGALLMFSLFHRVKSSVLGGADGGVVDEATGEVKPDKKGLSQEELTAAESKGVEPLAKLAVEHPSDARIHRALFRVNFMRGDTAEAMRALGRLFAVDPSAMEDSDLVTAVTVAAIDPNLETRDAALALLEGPLGSKGADILYDLSTRTPPVPGRKTFIASLNKPEVQSHATPALLVLMEMRTAKKCEDKRELLPRARQHGDARMLAQLKTLQKTSGCGFLRTRDCWSCLHKKGDTELDATVAALEARF